MTFDFETHWQFRSNRISVSCNARKQRGTRNHETSNLIRPIGTFDGCENEGRLPGVVKTESVVDSVSCSRELTTTPDTPPYLILHGAKGFDPHFKIAADYEHVSR